MPADPATAASPWTVTAPAIGEPNYDAIYAAVVATAQGRWFLAQYASRNRNADTAQLVAAIDRLQADVGRSVSPTAAQPNLPPGPDIARLRRDLSELTEALIRARADIATIKPGKLTERPSILAATEALLGLAWFMRERGMDPRSCDRIDDCADDIHAVCAMPDSTVQRTRMIIDTLGDLEKRLVAITAALDDGDQFADLLRLPGGERQFASAGKTCGGQNQNGRRRHHGLHRRPRGRNRADRFSRRLRRTRRCADAGPISAAGHGGGATPRRSAGGGQSGGRAVAAPLSPDDGGRARSLARCADQGRRNRASPARAGSRTRHRSKRRRRSPVKPPGVAAAAIEAASSDTIEVEVASSDTIEVEPAPVEPEAVPAALPPRRVAAIAKDLFADVMALSEEERVALFT